MAEYIERKIVEDSAEYDIYHNLVVPIRKVRAIPAADVAPVVHSRWEQCDYLEPCIHGFGTNRIKNAGMKCLNCVHVFKRDLLWTSNFCPNCGAKMDLED